MDSNNEIDKTGSQPTEDERNAEDNIKIDHQIVNTKPELVVISDENQPTTQDGI
jgi:hypothetical protein